MSRKYRILPLVLLLATVIAVASALPASAHKDGSCNAGDVCVYEHSGLTGGRLDFYFADSDWSNDRFYGTSRGINDEVSSIDSFDTLTWYFYKHKNYSDLKLRLYGGGVVYTLASGTNDELSSGTY